MSKPSSASTSKIPSQSAWAKGPPQTSSSVSSPRSLSPAPINAASPISATHSRRPSNLGQGVNIKEGVSVPRGNVGSVRQGSAVTFGSIDDVSAPISSSPATAPAVKTESIKSFGSVAATSNQTNGKSPSSISASAPSKQSSRSASISSIPSTATMTSAASSSTATSTTTSKPAISKMDVRKLFQNPSSSPVPSQSTSDTSSPSTRPSSLPPPHHQPPQTSSSQHQPPPSAQSSQFGAHPYPSYGPPNGLRPQQNGVGPNNAPRSPVYPRAMANGSAGGPPRPNGPGAPPIPASPRLATHAIHPHQGQPSGLPQGQMPMQWNYYYMQQDPYATAPYPGWGYAMQPHPIQQHPQHPHPPPGPPNGMPMSPRNQPPPLPGTPTMGHAIPNPAHSPHPTPSHQPSNSISGLSSPPPTPSTATGPGGRSLNTNASAFVPGTRTSKVTIKSQDGTELNLEALKKQSPVPPGSPGGAANRRSIRIESEDAKKRRIEEQKEKERLKKDTEDRLRREQEERKRKEEDERRKAEEDIARKKKEEEDERLRLEKEEKERLRKEKEEEERIRKEEEDKEKQRIADEKQAEEERERAKKEAEEEAERLKKEEALQQEQARLEEQEAEDVVEPAKPIESPVEIEEGEIAEEVSEPPVNGDNEVKLSKKEALRINTSTMSPPTDVRRRPGPLDLTGSKKDIPPPLPSAIATARIIEDLGQIQYPDGIRSPKVELNVGAKDGKFRYDRDFLLQFMSLCREKPDMLPPLDAIGIEPLDQASFAMARGGSGRHRQASGAMTPGGSMRQSAVGLGIGFGGKPATGGSFPSMGNFATPSSRLTSEERFAMASGARSASVGSGPAGLQFRPPMTRSPSQGGPGHPVGSNRTRSKRGEKRNDGNKVPGHQGQGYGTPMLGSGLSGLPLEPVAPLELSANRWVAGSTSRKPQVDVDSPETVDRKVKGLLNKLTMEKFESISDQIIAWANRSEKEQDGRTLIQVIRLVFEKATDEATWSEMYARLCRKMMEQISPKVQDDGIKNADGKPIAGGQLFRKYLLNRCQEDFERGWVAKEATAAAAVAKASEDKAAKAAHDKSGAGGEESELYSEEYYAAQKAKRQGLGLIKFIGELFKLQMLTERIMHECVKKLLGNVENPEEEEIESLCKLLTTVGQILDTPKARAHMDVYFTRMKELGKGNNVSSRMQFMLQDLVELRDRKWISRNAVAAPTTLAAVHEAAAKEKAAQEKESYQRQMSMSRGGSRRGGERGGDAQVGPDGWAVAGGSGLPRPPPKAGDLSNFGKIQKATPVTFGPSSIFVGGKKEQSLKREALSRTNSNSNMFSMLSQNPELAAEAAAVKSSRPPSRKASVDFNQTGLPEQPIQRKKLQLLPRSKPTEESTPAVTEGVSEDEPAESVTADVPSMTEAEAQKKIDEDVKEFFGVRNLEEAEVYFTNLPAEHRFRLVDKLVASALESKEADARLVGEFFAQASNKGACDANSFEDGFIPMAEFLDDIAIDAPKAFEYMAIMLRGAGMDKDEERLGRIAGKSMDSDKLLKLVSS